MPVKVDISLDEESMVEYTMYQVYTKGAGILSIVMGILNIALVYVFLQRREFGKMALFALMAVVILVGFPMYIRSSMRKQLKGHERIGVPVAYEFSDEGIRTTTGGRSGKASWKAFKKAVSRKGIIMLFDAKKQAIVLPTSQLGDQYTSVVDLIFKNMPAPAVRINRIDKKR
ncbi:hypothetical protein M2145_002865 [Lachnospiraceae bacterium PF1-21]|uniref:YcxB family protein n=1 Tax=Ohessyouella blattaphilus TaxID=2949333 RepID=A0ABT1ELT3_9FIRM|nr:YcxB family protein [Ohessyouella blattaphilus]MCP1110656.1 YcxB family protein [Ohessyouella blattaphilus]MCR8564050.1 YcxB family protein [Ohessyouella blattaphilus]MDL2250398.1 YcxB family protein [Lachnospiraceae bacterium OttesenSCG-928-J05]